MDHASHRRRQKAAKSSDNAACADLCTRVCAIFGTCAFKLAASERTALANGRILAVGGQQGLSKQET